MGGIYLTKKNVKTFNQSNHCTMWYPKIATIIHSSLFTALEK